MIERTLILVKPDGVCKKHIGKVLDRLEGAGLRLVGLKLTRLTQSVAEQFYKEHQGRPFYPGLMAFMTSAPIVASVWEGEGVVAKAREIMGSTNSPEAATGTLRREYGKDNRYNLVHGSDSVKSAEREIPFFFSSAELFDYQADDWQRQDTVSVTQH